MYVQIKTWDEMEEEFGISDNLDMGSIACKYAFNKQMEKQMPANRVIEITPYDDMIDEYNWEEWSISNDMIKEVLSEDYINYIKKHNLEDEM
jgi:hypothetical protein